MKNNLGLLEIFLRDVWARIVGWPSHITFFVTSECNYRCRMCFYWREIENKKKKFLTEEEYQKIAANFPAFTSAALTGGEPFLQPDLVEIARLFYDKARARSIFIPTNASLPKQIARETEKLLRACPKALITICLSLDGIGADHDYIRGVKGAFEKFVSTLKKLKLLQKKYPNLEINCSLTYSQYNQDKLFEIWQYATSRLGLKNFNVSLVRGNTREEKAKGIDIEKYLKVTHRIDGEAFKKHRLSKFGSVFEEIIFARLALVKEIVVEVYKKHRRFLPCLAGRFNLVITEEGDVYPCEMLGEKLGSLRKSGYDLKKILKSKRAAKIIGRIKAGNCYCTHEFNLPDNILYTPRGFKRLIGEWLRLKF